MLHATDEIWLDQSVFTKLKLGDLRKSAFYAHKNADEAKDGKDRIVYDPKSGKCYYDKDGIGGKEAKLFAILDNSPNDLNHNDFLVIA
jgi:serralysin